VHGRRMGGRGLHEAAPPVTYRAGTVPPRIEVGMVLRKEGHDVTVHGFRGDYAVCDTAGLPIEWHRLVLLGAPLARDWTESGGDGGGRAR
jgi:hypothetical protein